jgi:tRNA G10  N-methylase Trm11
MAIMSQPNQTTYLFIPGKNWKLSLAELTSFLDARSCKFEVLGFSRSFFYIKTEEPLEPAVIDELGGTLKIAQVAAFAPSELVNEAFIKESREAKKQLTELLPFEALAQRMPAAESGKAVFGVSVYWEQPEFRPVANRVQRALGSFVKDALKVKGKKARFMGFPRDRENPQLTAVEVLKQGLVEANAEVMFCVGKNTAAIGSTMAVHNPFEFQKRDVDKPVQRKIFGISPRIAKIMVNLTHCTAGETFLDPFCGVGNILQEALLTNAKVIGVDINRWCVEAARRNLEWVTSEYSVRDADFSVLVGDARNLRMKIPDMVDCIATEPDLGPALREIPTVPYAQDIIENLNPLFSDFLLSAHEVLRPGGILALVTPYIRTRSCKPVTMNVWEMARDVGFEAAQPFGGVSFVGDASNYPLREMASFVDLDERHKIGRQISVFRKP